MFVEQGDRAAVAGVASGIGEGVDDHVLDLLPRLPEVAPALAYLRNRSIPIVIKADGLAAGKGVIVAQNLPEAEAAGAKARILGWGGKVKKG